jgi:hypothetical protein
MEHSDQPAQNNEPPKGSSARASILLGTAILLAGLAVWQAQQDAPTPFVLLGIGALYVFGAAQILAGRPLVAGLAAAMTGAGLGAFLTSSEQF